MILGSAVSTENSRICSLDDVRMRDQSFVLASEGFEDSQKSFREIDYSWLPLCSDTYKISPNIQDYVFVEVPIITSGIPNRNCQAFDFLEISSWDVNQGSAVYKTFVGKPTYTNHKNNTIPHLAKGAHFDSTLVYVPKYDLHKINVLLGFDKVKDPGLCEAILASKGVNGYSMGAMV